jgi:hypothetical protein
MASGMGLRTASTFGAQITSGRAARARGGACRRETVGSGVNWPVLACAFVCTCAHVIRAVATEEGFFILACRMHIRNETVRNETLASYNPDSDFILNANLAP